jgi:hypothetical protein
MPGFAIFGANASCRGVRRSGKIFSLFGKGEAMEHLEVTKKPLCQFGLVGGIFLLIGLWPFVWRQEPIRIWVAVPGALLVALAERAFEHSAGVFSYCDACAGHRSSSAQHIF